MPFLLLPARVSADQEQDTQYRAAIAALIQDLPHCLHGGYGDVVARRETDDTVTIIEAAPTVSVSTALLLGSEGVSRHIEVDGECLVLARQVWYRPICITMDGQVVVCERARDDRSNA